MHLFQFLAMFWKALDEISRLSMSTHVLELLINKKKNAAGGGYEADKHMLNQKTSFLAAGVRYKAGNHMLNQKAIFFCRWRRLRGGQPYVKQKKQDLLPPEAATRRTTIC